MTTFKINKNKDFTVMSNYHLRDKNLSLKAKGLLSFMLSLPEAWDYSLKGLVAICKENNDAILQYVTNQKIKDYFISSPGLIITKKEINLFLTNFDIILNIINNIFSKSGKEANDILDYYFNITQLLYVKQEMKLVQNRIKFDLKKGFEIFNNYYHIDFQFLGTSEKATQSLKYKYICKNLESQNIITILKLKNLSFKEISSNKQIINDINKVAKDLNKKYPNIKILKDELKSDNIEIRNNIIKHIKKERKCLILIIS